MTPQESLLNFLVHAGHLTPLQLHKASQIQAQQGGDLLHVLVMMNFLSRDTLQQLQREHRERWPHLQPPPPPPPADALIDDHEAPLSDSSASSTNGSAAPSGFFSEPSGEARQGLSQPPSQPPPSSSPFAPSGSSAPSPPSLSKPGSESRLPSSQPRPTSELMQTVAMPPSFSDETMPPSFSDETMPPSLSDETMPPSLSDETMPPSLSDESFSSSPQKPSPHPVSLLQRPMSVPTARSPRSLGVDSFLQQVLDGRFVVQGKQLVRPGYRLYHGVDQATQRRVTIRLMPFVAFLNNQHVFRFKKEAEQWRTSEHPSLVPVYAHGAHPTWGAYLVHHYLEGPTLEEHLQERRSLELRDLLPLFEHLCGALDHLHRRGIPHRNLSFESLQWESYAKGAFGEFQLLPWGVSPLAFSELTLPWMLTLHADQPFQLCPELSTHSPTALNHRTDIYALGVMLFQLLTGRKPFVGDSDLWRLQQHIHARPLPLSEVRPTPQYPPKLQLLVSASLAKEPSQRPPSTSVWFNALAQAIAEAPELLIPLAQSTQAQTLLTPYIHEQGNLLLRRTGSAPIGPSMHHNEMFVRLAQALRTPPPPPQANESSQGSRS